MSEQLNTDLSSVVADHASLYSRAHTLFKRSNTRRVHATLNQEYSEGHRDKVAELATLIEGARDAHTPHTSKAESEQSLAATRRDAGWGAALSIRDSVDRAARAASATESIAGGDVSRYTDWLLSSPVATGTAIFTFGDVRPADNASLVFNFSASIHQTWDTQADHHHYE